MGLAKRFSVFFNVLHAFTLIVIILCIWLVIANPKKTLQLYPHPGIAVHLFSDAVEPKGTSAATWIDRSNGIYECNIGYGLQYPYCGMVIKYKNPELESYNWPDYFDYPDAHSIDLSSYDGITVSIDYTGPSNSLNFYLRNAKNLPKNYGDYEQVPYVHVDFIPSKNGAFIEFSKMQVAKWWIDRYNPPQNMRQPTFESVFEIGIDLPPLPAEGVHRFKLNRIAATKSYFPREKILPLIVVLVGLNFLILIIRGLLKYHSHRYNEENQTLRSTMVIDPLTRCLNRLGLEAAIDKMFPLMAGSGIYVMVLDLDHFKRINDSLGHVAGDDVLRQTSAALSKELRSDDVLGRWGGEEFVIICRISRDNLESLVQRLMRSLQNISIEGARDSYEVTVSIGVTEVRIGETFTDAFDRADKALYKVKQSGRNNWKLA